MLATELVDDQGPGKECARGCGTHSPHLLVLNDIPVHGYVYDVIAGTLIEVSEATVICQAA